MSNLTPEEDDILRHHPASPAADKIRAERAKAEWNERAAAEQAKQGAAHARIKDLEAKIASNVAEAAARDMRIADLERDLAAKDASLKTANAGLKRICEVIGAPVPCVAEDAVEAVKRQLGDDSDAERRAKTAEQALKDINLALLDAGAPRAYTHDKGERPIPDADRVRLLGDRVRGEWRERARVEADHSERGKAVNDAHLALDDRKAPRFADGVTLTLAARIRALTR